MTPLNAHALVIGIANYQHINALPPTVVKDASDIYGTLIEPQLCAYPPVNVRLVVDEQATREGLRTSLADLANRADKDAMVMIYLSSHGGRIEGGANAGEYLLPVDTVYDSDESLAATAISGREFTEALSKIPAAKVVVLFDCCHAGGIGQPKGASPLSLQAGLPESYYDALKTGRGRAILASSRSSELSWVLAGAENSLFTHHMLAGLRGGIASEDGLIRIFDLFEYIQPRVTADQKYQHPLFKAEIEENFPVAMAGGQVRAVPKDAQGFRYDAYVSYVDQEPDATWVWETLVPKLKTAGLRVAVSGDVEEPGVARVVNIERGISQSKRSVLVLSPAYLADNMAEFENVLAQTIGIQEGSYRLLPVKIAEIDSAKLPTRIGMLTTLDLAHPSRAEREFDRLVRALAGPLPQRSS